MSRRRKNNRTTGAPVLPCLHPHAAGGVVFHLYRKPTGRCSLAEKLPYRDGSDGIDGGLLEPIFSDLGGTRIQRIPGQRTSCQECAGGQIRCFRLSMVAVSACGGFAARIVPAGTGGLDGAFDPPPSE